MELLTSWVTNIILFVLLAIIVDLLMPNSSLQRYTKMVISLLLIVIILNPILKIFNSDLEKLLSTFTLPTIQEKNQMENLIENKKKEIQASQRAYILEQMAVQMETMVEEDLIQTFGIEVETVQLQFAEVNKEQLTADDLQAVTVIVTKKVANQNLESIPAVKDIRIDTTTPIENDDREELPLVQAFLATNWQLDQKVVKVVMEGGEM